MAEDFQQKTTLIEVEVDSTAALKNVDELTDAILQQNNAIADNNAEIRDLNKSNKDLSKEVQKGTKTQEQANSEIEENTARVNELKKENVFLKDGLKDLNKERNDAIKVTKLQSNSIDALKKRTSDLKKERDDLDTSTQRGKDRFEELTAVLEKNNETIRDADKSAGDFKTSIGNYADAAEDGKKSTGIFGSSLGNLFKMILANPVGILLSALVGLVAVFKESQTGAEFFRKAGAVLNTTLGALSDVVEFLGATLIEAFENPQQAITDLRKSIEDGIVNYFTEFIPNAIDQTLAGFGLLGEAVKKLFEGDFDGALQTAKEGSIELLDGLTDLNPGTALIKAGFEAAAPAIAEFASEVSKASMAAFGLEEALIANEKAIADLRVQEAQSIQSQKELNLVIEDTTKSYDDRIKAAEEFAAVEQAQIDQSVKLQKQRLDILKAQNDLTNSTEEDIQKVRDAEIELANLQAASFERRVTNQNKLNALRQAQEQEDIARREA